MTLSELTNLRGSLHLQYLYAFDNSSAGVVDAIKHRLETLISPPHVTGESLARTFNCIIVIVQDSVLCYTDSLILHRKPQSPCTPVLVTSLKMVSVTRCRCLSKLNFCLRLFGFTQVLHRSQMAPCCCA